MNPYFFRSISKAPESLLVNKSQMWPDYDGHPFGMLMGYSQETFDFEILSIKSFFVKSFSLLSSNSLSFAELNLYNTVDSYRVFLKKRTSRETTTFDYVRELGNQPNYEILRDIHYLQSKIRAYLDYTDFAINSYDKLISKKLYQVSAEIPFYDFLDKYNEVLANLQSEYQSFKSYFEGRFPAIFVEINHALEICSSRAHIIDSNSHSYDRVLALSSAESIFKNFNNDYTRILEKFEQLSKIENSILSIEENISNIQCIVNGLGNSWWNRYLRRLTNFLLRK